MRSLTAGWQGLPWKGLGGSSRGCWVAAADGAGQCSLLLLFDTCILRYACVRQFWQVLPDIISCRCHLRQWREAGLKFGVVRPPAHRTMRTTLNGMLLAGGIVVCLRQGQVGWGMCCAGSCADRYYNSIWAPLGTSTGDDPPRLATGPLVQPCDCAA